MQVGSDLHRQRKKNRARPRLIRIIALRKKGTPAINRHPLDVHNPLSGPHILDVDVRLLDGERLGKVAGAEAVSYTHLTLPTN